MYLVIICAYYCEPTVGYNEHSKYSISASIYIWEAAEASCIVMEASCLVGKVTTYSLEN